MKKSIFSFALLCICIGVYLQFFSSANAAFDNPATAAVSDSATIYQGENLINFDVIANDDTSPNGTSVGIDLDPSNPGLDTWREYPGVGVIESYSDYFIAFYPDPAFIGIASLEYALWDYNDDSQSNTTTIEVEVLADPNPPLLYDDTCTLATGGTKVCDVLGNDDVQNGAFIFSSLDLDTATPGVQQSVIIDAGTLQYNPFTGAFTITATTSPGTYTTLYNISDSAGVSNDATITIEVIVNSPPTASDASGAPINLPPGFQTRDIIMSGFVFDPEGYVFTDFDFDLDLSTPGNQLYRSTSNGDWSVVLTPTPTIRFQAYAVPGISTISYTVSDQFGNISNQATLSVSVQAAPPVANNDVASGVDGQNISIPYHINDNWNGSTSYTNLDFDPVTPGFQYVASTTLGTFEFTTGSTSLIFRSTPGLTGVATTSYQIFNTFGVPSNSALIAVTVNPNTPPTANSYTAPSVYPEQTVTISTSLLASDPNMTLPFSSSLFDLDLLTPGRQQTFSVAQGAWSTTASTLRFQPLSTFLGTILTPFTFTDDSSAVSNVATVTINVINDTPIAVSDNATAIVDTSKIINVISNDNPRGGSIAFVDLDPITLVNETSTTTPSGSWVVQPDNTIIFTPNSGFSGITSIQYAVEDSFGLRSGATTLTVNVESRPLLRLHHGAIAKNQLTARFNPANVPPVSPIGSVCPRFPLVSSSDLQNFSFSSDLEAVRSGTTYTGVIVIENVGNLPAYTISVFKERLEEVFVPSVSGNVCVSRGDGLEMVNGIDHFTGIQSNGGFFSLASSFGPLSQYHPTSGQNIIVITYDMTLADYITGHSSFVDVNTYSDSEFGVNLANDGNVYEKTFRATVSPALSGIDASITTPTLGITGLTIGQIIDYRVEIELPDTGTSSFPTTTVARLTLPTGTVFYDNNTGTPAAFASTTYSSVVTGVTYALNYISDRVLEFRLLSFINPDTNTATTETLSLSVPAVVTNIPGNTASGTSFVATADILRGSTVVSSTSSPVKILQEPALVLRNLTATSTNASGTIDFVFELFQSDSAISRSDAFDVEFYFQTDGPGLVPLTITNPVTGGLPAATTTIGSLFLSWPTISGAYTSSSPITISFTGQFTSTTSTTTLNYPVGLSFSTLPGTVTGPLSSFSLLSQERSYSGTTTFFASHISSASSIPPTPTTTVGCVGPGCGGGGVIGCMDPLALNYNQWATQSSGNCTYPSVLPPLPPATTTPPVIAPTSTPPVIAPTSTTPVVEPPLASTSTITYIPKTKRQLMLQLTGPLSTLPSQIRTKAMQVAAQEGNNLVLPQIGVNKPVLVLPNLEPLLNEFWILPWGSTPDKGSNTIIVGHSYNQRAGKQWPNTLFNLNKVKVGERITLNWQGKSYVYEVVDNQKFKPDQVYLEDDTVQSVLTIYTCGQYTTAYRQVARAVLVEVK